MAPQSLTLNLTLEQVLEADLAPQHSVPLPLWWLATWLSAEYRQLRDENDACRALLRRIVAVKFTSAEFAARGQAGVRPAPPEERALSARAQGSRLSGMLRPTPGGGPPLGAPPQGPSSTP